jgi:agmatine deiminase
MARTLTTTPAADGYRMPGEFERHAGCWLLWPERPDNWREHARPAQEAFVQLVSAIAEFEPVTIGASLSEYLRARDALPAAVRVIEIASDDCWMRDVGPTFVVDRLGGVRGVDWPFNAWGGLRGGLYSSWDQDDLVARKVLEIERCDRYRAPLINEGGAIHVDGEGTALVTEQCLLNVNRNPRMTVAAIENALRYYLGVERIVWLECGLVDDETDGHIDNLACFAKPGEVVLTTTADTDDPQYAVSEAAYARLTAARDARGRALIVHRLPMPGPLYMTDAEAAGVLERAGTKPRSGGQRLAASYVNFYLANGGVVAPLLDPRTDREALAVLRRVFPERRVVGVPARELLLGGGNIHCLTQQLPLASPARF